MPSGDLIGLDVQPFASQAAHELGWKEAVLRAQDEPGLNVGPGGEWPGGGHGSFRRVRAHSAQVLVGQLAWHIVVVGDVRIIVAGESAVACGLCADRGAVPDVGPPVTRWLARRRDDARDEHQDVGAESIGDERRGEPAERLTDNDQLAALANGRHHRVGVVSELRRGVVAWEIGRNDVVPAGAERWLDAMPVPATVARTVDQENVLTPRGIIARSRAARTCAVPLPHALAAGAFRW